MAEWQLKKEGTLIQVVFILKLFFSNRDVLLLTLYFRPPKLNKIKTIKYIKVQIHSFYSKHVWKLWEYQISISFSKRETGPISRVLFFLCLRVIQQHLAHKIVFKLPP